MPSSSDSPLSPSSSDSSGTDVVVAGSVERSGGLVVDVPADDDPHALRAAARATTTTINASRRQGMGYARLIHLENVRRASVLSEAAILSCPVARRRHGEHRRARG